MKSGQVYIKRSNAAARLMLRECSSEDFKHNPSDVFIPTKPTRESSRGYWVYLDLNKGEMRVTHKSCFSSFYGWELV